MELQSQHGPGGSLVVLQQPSRERRPRLEYERAAVLSLDQIRAIRSSNEYTEGPSVAPRKPPPCPAPRSEKQERTHEVILVNNNYERRPPVPPALIRSTSTSSGASSGGCSSASSEQGLLGRSPPPAGPTLARRPERIIQSQPKSQPLALSEEKALKPVWKEDSLEEHRFICERCGRCKCRECTAPRTLPSCLACQGHCLCSPESAVEHGTCMCLVRGVFYHCSNDDEGDSCADSPCSFSRPHCCSRFLCMGLMSVFFPCVLCYPLARGCVKACQGCYDRASRPGCRCKNSNTVYCKLENWSPEAFKKPS